MLDQIRNICRENFQADWFATDQPESADPAWITPIIYSFNSRGFRDGEWPDDLSGTIWCVGDSEMIGTGVSQQHTIPSQMSQLSSRPAVNVSIIRASNDWIARQCHCLLDCLPDARIVLQWSFTTRSELSLEAARDHELVGLYAAIKDTDWPVIKGFGDLGRLPRHIRDEVLRDPYCQKIQAMTGPQETGQIHYKKELLLDQAGARHLLDLIDAIQSRRVPAQIIHAFVPRFADAHERDLIYTHLRDRRVPFIPEYQPTDHGRDRQHSGPKTYGAFARTVLDSLQL